MKYDLTPWLPGSPVCFEGGTSHERYIAQTAFDSLVHRMRAAPPHFFENGMRMWQCRCVMRPLPPLSDVQ